MHYALSNVSGDQGASECRRRTMTAVSTYTRCNNHHGPNLPAPTPYLAVHDVSLLLPAPKAAGQDNEQCDRDAHHPKKFAQAIEVRHPCAGGGQEVLRQPEELRDQHAEVSEFDGRPQPGQVRALQRYIDARSQHLLRA